MLLHDKYIYKTHDSFREHFALLRCSACKAGCTTKHLVTAGLPCKSSQVLYKGATRSNTLLNHFFCEASCKGSENTQSSAQALLHTHAHTGVVGIAYCAAQDKCGTRAKQNKLVTLLGPPVHPALHYTKRHAMGLA